MCSVPFCQIFKMANLHFWSKCWKIQQFSIKEEVICWKNGTFGVNSYKLPIFGMFNGTDHIPRPAPFRCLKTPVPLRGTERNAGVLSYLIATLIMAPVPALTWSGQPGSYLIATLIMAPVQLVSKILFGSAERNAGCCLT